MTALRGLACQVLDRNPEEPLGLDELTAIHRRFQSVFVVMNLLTIALVALLIMRLARPSPTRGSVTLGLAFLALASAMVCAGQFYCLRRTSRVSRLRIERLTFLDALTGAHNHRYLEMALDAEVKRARRHGHHLCVAYIDLDRFKPVNDEFGHKVGDYVLADVGRLFLAVVRESDTLGRVGGDEFLIILPETDLSGARIFSERVRERMEEYVLQLSPTVALDYVTCSIGVAAYLDGEMTADELKNAGDQAMYRAKKAGGNRVST